jgi:hypothetical protein
VVVNSVYTDMCLKSLVAELMKSKENIGGQLGFPEGHLRED